MCILYIQTNFVLLFLFREAIGHMKEGEEEKTKTYSALIWTDKAIQKKDIEFLNDIKVVKYPDSFYFIFPLPRKESFVAGLLPANHRTWVLGTTRPVFKSWLCHLLVEWVGNSSTQSERRSLFLYIFKILFIFRERGKAGQREEEKHQ